MCRRHERVVFDGLIRSPYVVSFDDIPTQRFARGAVKSHSKLLMEEGPEVLHNHAGEKAIEIRLPMDFIAWPKKSGELDGMIAFHAQNICPVRVPIPLECNGTDRLW